MSEVLLERRDGVAVITLNTPERRNALTLPIAAALKDAVHECEQDPEVRAIVVTGAPPAFCAGADLTALGEAREEGLRAIYAGFLAVANCTLPTVAAVGGAAVGAGLNLALACDVRLVGPDATFDARFLQIGIHPGGGMTWMLQRAVSPQTAKVMTLLGQVLSAGEAVRTGLAWQLVDGDLVDAAVQLSMIDAPRELVRTTKQTMRVTAGQDHETAVETELAAQLESMRSTAFAERLASLQRRVQGVT